MANWSNEIVGERNEMVFENRNRDYGAYQIRRQYGNIVLASSGLATVALLLCFFIFNPREVEKPKPKEKITEVVLKDAPPVNKDAPPPPPKVQMLKFTTPEITEEEVKDPPINSDTIKTIGIVNQDGSEDPPPDVITPVVDKAVEQKVEEAFTFAEVMPEMPGAGFQAYLKNNIKYPQIEKEAGKMGTVYISFVVEKDGSISNVAPAKEVPGAPGLTKEAVRVISQMPKWTPGQMNGRPVRIQMTQPVRFVLQ